MLSNARGGKRLDKSNRFDRRKYGRLCSLYCYSATIDKAMTKPDRWPDVARQRAEWMRPTDEYILELLQDEGKLTPGAIGETEITDAGYASNRLSEMADYGLVVRVAHGLYGLTEEGEAFLNGEFDASELEADNSG